MVIINNIRKPHTSSVGSPYQPKGTGVAVPEHFRRVTLNQQAIGLPHLFTAYTRREGSHIRPEPTIVPVYLIYLVAAHPRSEEHTSELQSLMRISYAFFYLQKTKTLHNA